jgi:hypothetical protein
MLVLAPKLFPWKMGPSLMVKVARSNEGAVEREFLSGAARWLPETTDAFPLTCVPSLTTLAKAEVGLMAADLKTLEIMLMVIVVVVMMMMMLDVIEL